MRVIQQLQLDRTQVVHLFDDLVRQTPEGVYLTSLKQAGRTSRCRVSPSRMREYRR